MAAHKYLRVRNWDRYQHYQSGRHAEPPLKWVKLHTAMLNDWELTSLSVEAQLLADRLLLVAGMGGNCIPNDKNWISTATKVNVKWVPRALDELRGIGFIEPFSAKAKSRQRLAQNREEEIRKETPLPPFNEGTSKPLPESVIDFRNILRDVA